MEIAHSSAPGEHHLILLDKQPLLLRMACSASSICPAMHAIDAVEAMVYCMNVQLPGDGMVPTRRRIFGYPARGRHLSLLICSFALHFEEAMVLLSACTGIHHRHIVHGLRHGHLNAIAAG